MTVSRESVLQCCLEACKEIENTATVTAENKQEADEMETMCGEHGYDHVVHRFDDTHLFIGRFIPQHILDQFEEYNCTDVTVQEEGGEPSKSRGHLYLLR